MHVFVAVYRTHDVHPPFKRWPRIGGVEEIGPAVAVHVASGQSAAQRLVKGIHTSADRDGIVVLEDPNGGLVVRVTRRLGRRCGPLRDAILVDVRAARERGAKAPLTLLGTEHGGVVRHENGAVGDQARGCRRGGFRGFGARAPKPREKSRNHRQIP